MDGVTFTVGEGSEATFTVEEKFARVTLPNDAVMRTTALSGEMHLDGRPSVIEIDLHRLSSDQSRRDGYVRTPDVPQRPHSNLYPGRCHTAARRVHRRR